jgi:hypothetical protein
VEIVYTEIPLAELEAAVENTEGAGHGFIVEGTYQDLKNFISFDSNSLERMIPGEPYKAYLKPDTGFSVPKKLILDKIEGPSPEEESKSVFADVERASITEDLFIVEQNKQGKITIKGFTGSQTHVVIPDRISGIEVSEIGDNVFNAAARARSQGQRSVELYPGTSKPRFLWKLKSVILPKTLVRIGARAFVYNDLTAIDIPNSVTAIGAGAFAYNELTALTIPNTVTTIGEAVFLRNRLTSLQLSKRLTTLEPTTFMENYLTEVTIPDSVVTLNSEGGGISTSLLILQFAPFGPFANNPLKRIILGSGLKEINIVALNPNKGDITEITIGSDVEFGNYSDNLALLFSGTRKSEFKKVTDGPFINYYISQGRKAGTYVLNGQIWSRKY